MEALERIAQGLFFTRSKMFLNHSPERHFLGKSIIPPPKFCDASYAILLDLERS